MARAQELRGMIDGCLQAILDLRMHLRCCHAPAFLEDEALYGQLVEAHLAFQQRARFLYRVLRSVAGRGQLAGLFVQLNFNSYYHAGGRD